VYQLRYELKNRSALINKIYYRGGGEATCVRSAWVVGVEVCLLSMDSRGVVVVVLGVLVFTLDSVSSLVSHESSCASS
jgi:hypothetical protein